MQNFTFSLGFFALLTVTVTTALICPDASTIAPCTCSASDGEASCEGDTVTQDSINQLFALLRQSNSIPTDDWLPLTSFSLQSTQLTSLDLTPLFKTRLEEILIFANPQLSSISGDNGGSGNEGSIDTTDLYMLGNALTDQGLSNTLPYFTSSSLQLLYLSQNQIQGTQSAVGDGSGDIEFLRGLSAFGNLQALELKQNKITSLSGGQFKRNSNLSRLQLSNNGMVELGENALLFDDTVAGGTEFRYIYLGNNQLTDAAISPANGLSARALVNQVSLNANGLEFISQANFQPFLDANKENSLVLSENAFVCDSRMKWLKDGIDSYQFRVSDVNCVNDPGETIFTTELV